MNLLLEQVDESLTIVGQELAIEFGDKQTLALEITGGRGPQGPPGPAGNAMVELVASGPISGHRAICDASGLAIYADPTSDATAHNLIGVSYGAAVDGGTVSVVTTGPLADPAFLFTPGLPVYVGPGGTLVQTPSAGGYIRRIGYARDATTLYIQIAQPIITGG
jgi:hypothetical protein